MKKSTYLGIALILFSMIIFLLIVSSALLSGDECNENCLLATEISATNAQIFYDIRASEVAMEPFRYASAQTVLVDNISEPVNQPQAPNQTQERVIIRNAQLNLLVEDVQAVSDAIIELTNDGDGWVVSNSISRNTSAAYEPYLSGSLQIRIPAEKLDETLEQIRELTLSVIFERVDGQDVTAEFVDLNSQLGNLQAAETQLQSLMEQAENTEAVLEVYRELVNIRGQIEVIQGRLKYLSESAAFSSVNISLETEREERSITESSEDFNLVKTGENALNALMDALKFLLQLLVWIGLFALPLLMLIITPIWLIYRRFFRKKPA